MVMTRANRPPNRSARATRNAVSGSRVSPVDSTMTPGGASLHSNARASTPATRGKCAAIGPTARSTTASPNVIVSSAPGPVPGAGPANALASPCPGRDGAAGSVRFSVYDAIAGFRWAGVPRSGAPTGSWLGSNHVETSSIAFRRLRPRRTAPCRLTRRSESDLFRWQASVPGR